MSKQFKCPDCGVLTHAVLCGYLVADGIIDNVDFHVLVRDDGTPLVCVAPYDAEYFENFNTKKFIKKAEEVCKKTDEFICDKCGIDIANPFV